MSDAKLSKLPSGWSCLNCKSPLPKAMSMLGHERPVIRKNAIVICSACGAAHILGDTSLRPLLGKDFKAYPAATQRAIIMTVRGIRQKLNQGGEWSPYEKQ